jgi:hypothetical protein
MQDNKDNKFIANDPTFVDPDAPGYNDGSGVEYCDYCMDTKEDCTGYKCWIK